MNRLDSITLRASLKALAEQDAPLPDTAQQRLRHMAESLSIQQAEALEALRTVVLTNPELEQSYNAAYQEWQQRYQTQERAKSLEVEIASFSDLNVAQIVLQLSSSEDLPSAARQIMRQEELLRELEQEWKLFQERERESEREMQKLAQQIRNSREKRRQLQNRKLELDRELEQLTQGLKNEQSQEQETWEQGYSTSLDETRQKQSDFWKRGDRVIAMASGGAALGAMVGQTPGALIGTVLTGIYGW